ncbi:hypothetical protein CC86DRAFT_48565 [Ophiobolus disseminans]|uniref:Uncharacterized protein n=1 Tax=Ophiobolus disseminans TaxID=1469910 RepID=A0A6A6ZVR5_9PLEO|nr:hypothetical protein CC86DRAFT_48565 [Ophiobolus disseminans]
MAVRACRRNRDGQPTPPCIFCDADIHKEPFEDAAFSPRSSKRQSVRRFPCHLLCYMVNRAFNVSADKGRP